MATGSNRLVLPCDRARIHSAPRLVDDRDDDVGENTWGVRGGPRRTFDAALAGSVTAAEGVYALCLIDERALDGFVAAAGAQDTTFAGLIDRASMLEQATGNSLDGSISRLSGYVAEQQVASHLVERGAVVEFPESPNNPGYDLFVDGVPVQVKCLSSSSGIYEHLERYPDIPVIANVELLDEVGNTAGVYIDEQLSHHAVREATEETLQGLQHLDDVGGFVPGVALALSAFRHVPAAVGGKISAVEAAKRMAVDTVPVALLGWLGSFTGGAVGAMLGPAGVVLLSSAGAYVGARAGRCAADVLSLAPAAASCNAAALALADFGIWFTREVLPARYDAISRRLKRAEEASRATPRNSVVSAGVKRLVDELSVALTRTRRVQDYMIRTAFAERQSDRVNAGWVATRLCPHTYHVQLDDRCRVVESAIQAYRQQLESLGDAAGR